MALPIPDSRRLLAQSQDGIQCYFNLRDGIPIISNREMIFELMEAHFHRLTAIRQKGQRIIPSTAASLGFKGLGLCDNLFVATPSP